MPLRDLVPMIAPRERAGARATRGFSFQKDWAICEILRRHELPEEYLVAFDYQEDFVLVNRPSTDAEMHFFQIKGRRSGTCSMAYLVHRAKKKSGARDLSIVAKLYDNKLRYPGNTASLNFVTNVPFKVALRPTEKEASTERLEISFELIDPTERKKAEKTVQAEHSLSEEPQLHPYTFLRIAKLDLLDSESHAVGKIDGFLEKRAPSRKRHSRPFYQALFTEVDRRSKVAEVISSYEEFLEMKALTRGQIEDFVSMAGVAVDLDALWAVVEQRLNVEGMSVSRIRSLRQAWLRYEVERLDGQNSLVRRVRAAIQQFLSQPERNHIPTLTALLKEAGDDALLQASRSSVFTPPYLEAAVLLEFYEGSELPSPSSESKKAR